MTDGPQDGGATRRRNGLDAVSEHTHSGHRQRLRSRFLDSGDEALSDHELLELLLFGAIPRRDVKPLAKTLIARFGSLGGVLNASPAQLERSAGLSPTATAQLRVAAACARRMLKEKVMDRPVLSSWNALLDYLNLALKYEDTEQVRLLFLDRRNRLMADEHQARGTVDHAPVYPREVVRRCLDLSASAVIMVHNHPSGDVTPSRADVEMTRAVEAALKAVGIVLHDHLIVGRGGHASFKSLGLL